MSFTCCCPKRSHRYSLAFPLQVQCTCNCTASSTCCFPKKISPVFARLCFSQLLNHDAESVPARLEVLRIISSVKHSQITQQQSSKAFYRWSHCDERKSPYSGQVPQGHGSSPQHCRRKVLIAAQTLASSPKTQDHCHCQCELQLIS